MITFLQFDILIFLNYNQIASNFCSNTSQNSSFHKSILGPVLQVKTLAQIEAFTRDKGFLIDLYKPHNLSVSLE